MAAIENPEDLVEFVAGIPWSLKDRDLREEYAGLPKDVTRAFNRIVTAEALTRRDCLVSEGRAKRFVPSDLFAEEVTRIAGWLAESGYLPEAGTGSNAYSALLDESLGQTVMTMPEGFKWKWIRDIDDIEAHYAVIGHDMGLDGYYELRDGGDDELPQHAAYLALLDGRNRSVGALWLSGLNIQDSHRHEKGIGKRKFDAMCRLAVAYVGPRLVLEMAPTAPMRAGEHFNNYGEVVHVNGRGVLHCADGPAYVPPDEGEPGEYYLDGVEVTKSAVMGRARPSRSQPGAGRLGDDSYVSRAVLDTSKPGRLGDDDDDIRQYLTPRY